MDVIAAYRELGSFRAAAAVTGTTHKTVRRIVEAHEQGPAEPRPRGHNYEVVADIVRERASCAQTGGSPRNGCCPRQELPVMPARPATSAVWSPRRRGASAKATTAGDAPGCGRRVRCSRSTGGVSQACTSFVQSQPGADSGSCAFRTTSGVTRRSRFLAECFEILGGVPKVVLADRMGCLKAGVVANLVVPVPDYVRFATHYGFRPDFCEAADPESKGLVEHLVGYAKSDLMVPSKLTAGDLAGANDEARQWCQEVNGTTHSEIFAIPAERLDKERELFGTLPSLRASLVPLVTRKVDKLSCIRFGSARYSVPVRHIGRNVQAPRREGSRVDILDLGEIIASHDLVAPGEVSVCDEHYGGPRPAPRRAPRPRTEAERAFLSLGEVAASFLKGAAATASTRLPGELEELGRLEGCLWSRGPRRFFGAGRSLWQVPSR